MEHAVGLGQVTVSGADIYWNEARPAEGGRLVVVRRAPDGSVADVVAPGYSARTRVHEYGGVSYVARDRVVWFTNFTDQRIYRAEDGADPVPVTPDPPVPAGVRFANPTLTPDGRWLIAVRETHDGDVVNDVAAIATDTGDAHGLVGGHDFFAAPRLSPDGSQLAWLSWDHPNMPWDGTELWVAPIDRDANLGPARLVAGSRSESISQPRWSPDGRLHYISDRTGWWNLYVDDGGAGRALAPRAAEFAEPDWTLGQSSFVFLDDGTIVVVWHSAGTRPARLPAARARARARVARDRRPVHLAREPGRGRRRRGRGRRVRRPRARRWCGSRCPSGDVEVLKRGRERAVDPGYVSVPSPIEFPTEDGLHAHALFYRPANQDFAGPDDERPPLIVVSHGGPTGATDSVLNLGIQFWTSRGFAVVDVDYGGSTGYGRAYRERLRNRWGIVDVDDCVNAARWLADEGEVDGSRMVIRGGERGRVHDAGRARVPRRLRGGGQCVRRGRRRGARARHAQVRIPLPRRPHRSVAGSRRALRRAVADPPHRRLDCPLILFQGLEDEIVPPAQSEIMADALRAKGVPVAYLAFEGEQHGFRKAENIIRVAEAELWFYGQVLGFVPADVIEPVAIDNAAALHDHRSH